MICKNCGNTVRDGAAFCPRCGTKMMAEQRGNGSFFHKASDLEAAPFAENQAGEIIRDQRRSDEAAEDENWATRENVFRETSDHPAVLNRNLPPDRSLLRYFFTPVAISYIVTLMNMIIQRGIAYYGNNLFAAAAVYNNALNMTKLLCNLFLCGFAFLITRSGKEKTGAKALFAMSIVLSLIPALTAPFMRPLFTGVPEAATSISPNLVLLCFVIAGGIGIILGCLLRPGRVWIYAVVGAGVLILGIILRFVFMRLRISAAPYYCISTGLSYFAFYAFPIVGLSAAWVKEPAPGCLIKILPSNVRQTRKFDDLSELPLELQREAPSAGISILGFFFPPAGFVLWLVWNRSFPGKSRSAGEGAAAGAIILGIAGFLIFALILMIRPLL